MDQPEFRTGTRSNGTTLIAHEIEQVLEETKTNRGITSWKFFICLDAAAKAGRVDIVDRLLAVATNPLMVACSTLQHAATGSHYAVVRSLLKAEKDMTSAEGFYSLATLEAAAQEENHAEAQRLREAKQALEGLQRSKNLALQISAERGDTHIMEILIEAGADVNAGSVRYSSYERTALSAAAKGGHVQSVECLLKNHVDINQNSRKDGTPLEAASESGQLNVVNRLLQAGPNLNDKALHRAAKSGHIAVVRRLLDAGVMVDADVKQINHFSETVPRLRSTEFTALQLAAHGGHLEIVQMLLQAGADVNIEASNHGRTALQAAAGSGSIEVVKILFAAGADVNARSGNPGRTPLQAAAEIGRLDIINLLFEAGAEIETETTCSGYSHFCAGQQVSALELAAKGGHLKVLQTLLQHMQDENAIHTIFRARALRLAIDARHIEVVRSLLSANTPVSDPEGRMSPLLSLAVQTGDVVMVRILLEAKADPHGPPKSDGWNQTPLQTAVDGEHVEIVRLLLAEGVNVDKTEGRLLPPLHTAARKGNVTIVKMLLDAGANVNAIPYTEETVLEAAKNGGNVEVLELINAARALSTIENKIETKLVVTKNSRVTSLCSTCSKLPLEVFEPNCYRNFVWHPSLTSVWNSVEDGCPFCMFFWRQLHIDKIAAVPQPSEVSLYFQNLGLMTGDIREPFPDDVECPKRICGGFHFSVEPFEGKRKAIAGNTASLETFDQIRSWLYRCIAGHSKCKLDSEEIFLPTRLIDLKLLKDHRVVKLINSNHLPEKGVQYITLTHCWRGELMDSAITTRNTLNARCVSIPVSDLPLSFVNAAEIATTLGIRYLWIDSLCIIQDSPEDFDRESSMMSKVYMHAFCTIAAAAPGSSSEGLFREYELNNDSVEFQCTSSQGESKKVLAMKCQQSWQTMYSAGALSKRGWALQERELSPRILHYTGTEVPQVLWECRTFRATEGWPTDNMPEEWPKPIPRIMDSIDNLVEHNLFDLWHGAVTDYTSRQLTKAEDKLPALAGLARAVGKYTKCEYIAGLWGDDFLRSLAWTRDTGNDHTMILHKRYDTYIAPTWSWASVDGHTCFSSITAKPRSQEAGDEGQHEKGSISIRSHHIQLEGSDPFGQLKSGYLQISAPTVSGVLGYDASYNKFGQIISLEDFSGEHILGNMGFDIPSERGSLVVVRCVYLFSQENLENLDKEPTGMGLALVPVDGCENTYRRVGSIRQLKRKFFEEAKVLDFTLI